jgi:DNA-binding MarR family transcriptional regulator
MARPRKKPPVSQPHAAAQPRGKPFVPPATITLPAMLQSGRDLAFRETLYLMVLAFGRIQSFREGFGKFLSLTGSQFIVLIGTAYRQGHDLRLDPHAGRPPVGQPRATTEVGRLIGKGLSQAGQHGDRRSVLVRLTPEGEAAVHAINPAPPRQRSAFSRTSRARLRRRVALPPTFALNSEYALAEFAAPSANARDRRAGQS